MLSISHPFRILVTLVAVLTALSVAMSPERKVGQPSDQRIIVPAFSQGATPETGYLIVQTLRPRLPGNGMTAAGTAMIQAAQALDEAAQALLREAERLDDSELEELARRWQQVATTLRSRGSWMIVAVTGDSMVHEPDWARQVNLRNLRGNGLVMQAESQAMIGYGQAMIEQVDQARSRGAIPSDLADKLGTTAEALVAAGEQLERDGRIMQAYAERLLTSLAE